MDYLLAYSSGSAAVFRDRVVKRPLLQSFQGVVGGQDAFGPDC